LFLTLDIFFSPTESNTPNQAIRKRIRSLVQSIRFSPFPFLSIDIADEQRYRREATLIRPGELYRLTKRS